MAGALIRESVHRTIDVKSLFLMPWATPLSEYVFQCCECIYVCIFFLLNFISKNGNHNFRATMSIDGKLKGRCRGTFVGDVILNLLSQPYQNCNADDNVYCHNQHTCQACSHVTNCYWNRSGGYCMPSANLTMEEQQVCSSHLYLFHEI